MSESVLEEAIADLRAEAATWRTLFLRAAVSLKAASTVTEGTLTKCRECRAWYNDAGNCTHEGRCQTGRLLGLAAEAHHFPPGFYPVAALSEVDLLRCDRCGSPPHYGLLAAGDVCARTSDGRRRLTPAGFPSEGACPGTLIAEGNHGD